MGLFDTIVLDPPMKCPHCGSAFSLQTKHFDRAMLTYRIGSIISGSPALSGIFPEELYCETCRRADREHVKAVYLVVWHTILAGVELSEADAEARLASVDRVDLIRWLDESQNAEREWQQRFWGLYRDVHQWHEHVRREANRAGADDDVPAPLPRRLSALWRLPQEILDSPDPLAAILEQHRRSNDEQEGDVLGG
ncbi:MAG: hypothetical protein ACOCVK_02560 [bacterium]